MTESEILSNAIQAAQATAAIFSLFLTIVSAYIAALYFRPEPRRACARWRSLRREHRIPGAGAMAMNLQYLGEGLHFAWQKLPHKSSGMEVLGPPIVVRSLFLDGREAAAWAAWTMGGVVYLALAYLSFIYRWPQRPQP